MVTRRARAVDLEPAVALHVLRRRAALAPQDRAQPRQQFARLERLRQIVVGADLEPDHAVHGVAARGQHQDRHVGGLADAAADFEPVGVGQHQVEHQRVELLALQPLLALARGRRRGNAKARGAEIVADHAGEALVVVDDEDAAGHGAIIAGASAKVRGRAQALSALRRGPIACSFAGGRAGAGSSGLPLIPRKRESRLGSGPWVPAFAGTSGWRANRGASAASARPSGRGRRAAPGSAPRRHRRPRR